MAIDTFIRNWQGKFKYVQDIFFLWCLRIPHSASRESDTGVSAF